jgi:hypothetical protein
MNQNITTTADQLNASVQPHLHQIRLRVARHLQFNRQGHPAPTWHQPLPFWHHHPTSDTHVNSKPPTGNVLPHIKQAKFNCLVCLTCTKSGSGWRGISSSIAKPILPQLGTIQNPSGTTTPLPPFPAPPSVINKLARDLHHKHEPASNKTEFYSARHLTCTKSGSGWRGISSSTAKPILPQLGTNHSPSGTTTPLPTSTPPALNTAPSVVPGAAAFIPFPLPLLLPLLLLLLRPNPSPNQPLLPRWLPVAAPAAALLAGPNPNPKNPSCRPNPNPPALPSALLLATLMVPPGPRLPWNDSAAAADSGCWWGGGVRVEVRGVWRSSGSHAPAAAGPAA